MAVCCICFTADFKILWNIFKSCNASSEIFLWPTFQKLSMLQATDYIQSPSDAPPWQHTHAEKNYEIASTHIEQTQTSNICLQVRILSDNKQAQLSGIILLTNISNLIGNTYFRKHWILEHQYPDQSASTEAIFPSTWSCHAHLVSVWN